ncbi:PREDICTED: uncharacterized protein LOC106743067 [Dinoponera quadriceps]|uniref:Uncharacterized protein LOC106743067 n=1 Tax=Dinoponera quadriceps TaxID=609295 RepID=A0A6P3X129_DINQU|nr:PREDICTED: uncharacterized protein LOC106743067 [Dinoponera quadriceps]XP_014472061.1 PREDICTED: uncharacterized protein LOC106743067 [Dinoponera quadriceps]XP_014472062.1 PREDICTED: uncharacterized protein LOC106743067 [Dinoponera quadriceps]XP_014472063.1 PREDICTED: uncharacterized protein LOC106743067 [Dinoponera quadriceps]XP_014472064.1 PREDICTED: uncharacterized protein LOC106743067 [Dinoponera quadriceps]XP_014472065.1 PREDICTED: uncharacterized protein LOC106743067 [Dinoponera quadr
MAVNNEVVPDQNFEDMKSLAIEQQQCFYEHLCDCMKYQFDEHKYLKQNIGYACYGPPNNENTDAIESNVHYNTENQNEDADITDTVDYNDKAKAVIDKIYHKICEYTIGTNCNEPIYFTIIYNVVVCSKPKKSKEEIDETEERDDKGFVVIPIPIFKIWRKKEIKGTEKKAKKEKEAAKKLLKTDEEYEIWYIDTTGRIYKDWADYKTNNNLFECTMVLPKDGLYQPDPSCPITEDYSTVWLEIMDSPACSLASQICSGVDIASAITGTGAAVLGVASLFTPLAPVVAVTGLVATGTTAVWAMARGTQQLIDRSTHEESINPLDRDAFPQWLTITGSVFGLGAIGGAAAISTAVSRGMTVNTAARLAFNTVQGSNLFLNGVGIVYQGYCMVDRYNTDETISWFDAVSMATHLMFFAGTVVNIQFAGDIIESNQNRIIDDYRDTLRSKNLRKKFNRIKRRATANNSCKMSENAEVIRYIKNRIQLLSSDPNASTSVVDNRSSINPMTENVKPNIIIRTIENGILVINGIALLDAVEFVMQLIRTGIPTDSNEDNRSDLESYESDLGTAQLCSLLDRLLSTHNLNISDFGPVNMSELLPLLREMHSLNVDGDLLQKIFSIAMKLIRLSRSPKEFLFKTMRLIWLYCKTNLRQWGITTCLRRQSIAGFKILRMIITALFESDRLDNLYIAFEKWMDHLMIS